MKKNFNDVTKSDIPLDASLTPSTKTTKSKTTTTTTKSKPKINAIGKKATAKTKSQPKQNKELRDKLSKDNVSNQDLEKLNEENIKNYRFRNRRNNVIIILLSVMLAISIAAIAIYIATSRLENNCFMNIYGEVDATFVLNGEEYNKFRCRPEVTGNRTIEIDISVKIKSTGTYDIKFIPKCYQNKVLMENTLVYKPNFEYFSEGEDGYYVCKQPIEITETTTINLCKGVVLDLAYEDTLNINNFMMNFDVVFAKKV